MPPTETGHMCISKQTAISKGPLGVRRCRLQSDNENTVLTHLVFPADPRVAFALYSAFKLLHKNNLFVRSLSVSSLTQIRGPRGEGNTRVGGGRTRIPRTASVSGLVCGPPVSMKDRLGMLSFLLLSLLFCQAAGLHNFIKQSQRSHVKTRQETFGDLWIFEG